MKIIKLMIKNFRAIGSEGVSIDLENNNLVFLIGKNNAGKSSILLAYEMFVITGKKATENDFFGKNVSNKIEIEAWLKDENDDIQKLKLSKWFNPEKIAKVKKIWSTEKGEGKKESFVVEKNDWEDGGFGGLDTILQSICPTPIWIKGLTSSEDVINLLQNLVKETIISKMENTDTYKKAEIAVQNLQSEIAKNEYVCKIAEQLNDAMSQIFPDISCNLISSGEHDFIKTLGTQTNVEINQTDKPNLGLDYHGHGTRRQFILSAYRQLATPLTEIKKNKPQRKDDKFSITSETSHSKSKMLLFEEPELFLHPEAIFSVIDILYSLAEEKSEFQMMVATHAPIMIDLSKNHTTLVRVVNHSNKGTSVFQSTSTLFNEDERQSMIMLNRFNPHISEAFFADRVILVEGDTETVAVRTLLEKFKEEQVLELSEHINVVNCGSKMNIPLFQKVLNHFRIPYYVLHDIDSKKNKNGKKNSAWEINDKIWKEIENAKNEEVRRFVFTLNFEDAHNYKPKDKLGKPFSAYQEVLKWDINDTSKLLIKYLHVILKKEKLEQKFPPDELEKLHDEKSKNLSKHNQSELF
ncbi:MAG: ATP-dependent endonuclease [Gammaproteobacteria bacterium]|nr:MAG: ATP-dependent endonuclease [Gammaproteobacteria bacterium]